MPTHKLRFLPIVLAALATGLWAGSGAGAFAREDPVGTVPRPDRVVLAGEDDLDGAASLETCAARPFADARMHLRVYKDGSCVLDRGLRSDSVQDVPGENGILERSGIVETAWVSRDGRGALLATLRYTDRVRLIPAEGGPIEDGFGASTTLTWIEPSFPEGRFEIALEPGRIVKDAVALPLGFGAALSTQRHDAAEADFRLYDLSGELVLRVPEREASALTLSTTSLGGFVAVDLALTASPAGPDRALRVYDLLQGKWWDYTWSYGSPREPLSWSLEDSGVLEVRLPGATRRFDRNGQGAGERGPKGETRPGPRRIFNRLRD